MTCHFSQSEVCSGRSQRWRTAGCLAIGVLLAAMAGCRTQPAVDLEEFDLTPAHDEMTEFSLGSYTVPIPVLQSKNRDHPVRSNRLEFSFALYALVTPDQQSSLADAWERHEGKIRDRVIRVCRNASLAELEEPELATLRSHLADAVQAEVGAKGVRRLLITDVVSQEL
jgi:hypothetical protein